MDLDTIIPIVIVAVAYLYRAFEESRKKGKEKEAQQEQGRPLPGPDKTSRRPRVPTPNAAPVPTPAPVPDTAPLPASGKTVRRVPPAEQKNWWEEQLRPVSEPSRPVQSEIQHRSEPSRPAHPDLRHTPVRASSKRVPVKPVYPPEPVEAEADHLEFDLEDAVIKSVILERRTF